MAIFTEEDLEGLAHLILRIIDEKRDLEIEVRELRAEVKRRRDQDSAAVNEGFRETGRILAALSKKGGE